MHKYTLGSYVKGKATKKIRSEIAMIKNTIREKNKELIWINEFQKDGYTATARKLNHR